MTTRPTYRILYHHRIRADDGQAVHVRELVSALRAHGHEVVECALVPKTGRLAGAPAGGFWQRLSVPRVARECLEIAYSRQGHRALMRAAATLRPDFVYERHALHCTAGLRAARELGVPFLLEVNSPLCDETETLGLLRFPRRARRTEREVLAGADRVIAVTAVLGERLRRCGADPARTLIVHNGADPARYGAASRQQAARLRAASGTPEAAFVLGFVGFMREWHRLDLAVELLRGPELEAVHLWLLGDGPALAAVVARARALGVAERVHAFGAVPAADVPGHVCGFDAALIPAINDYASPLKLFDSLAAGVATLAPRQDNLREVLEDGVNGLLFEPGDAGSLRRALTGLVTDRERARTIGAAGRDSLEANDWTWSGNARRVVRAFESLRARAEVGS